MSMLQVPMSEKEKEAIEKRVALRVEENLLFYLGFGFLGVFFTKILGLTPFDPPLVSETVSFGMGAAICFAVSFLFSSMRRRQR